MPQKKSRAGRVVKSTIEEFFKCTEITDPQERSSDYLSDYTWEATSGFLKEWAENNLSEEDDDGNVKTAEVPTEVEEAVREAIEDNAGKSLWDSQRQWLLNAIESSAEEAMRVTEADGAIEAVLEDKGIISIRIGKPFLKIWREEVEGQGYSAWGGDEKLSDVKDACFVFRVLDGLAEVYGFKSISVYHELAIDERFEPDTGNYSQLSRVANEALKKAQKNRLRRK